jgi:hypothetical protein
MQHGWISKPIKDDKYESSHNRWFHSMRFQESSISSGRKQINVTNVAQM